MIVRREVSPEGVFYRGYGIRVLTRDRDGTRCTVEVRDLCSRPRSVRQLVRRCNRLELDPIHLSDVVEDFLAGGDWCRKTRQSLKPFPGK